jgi:fused signal recognition particle receptor
VVLAVRRELDVPIRYVGVGEGIDDLRPFDPHEFTRALLQEEAAGNTAPGAVA